jgi:hypothetical protein
MVSHWRFASTTALAVLSFALGLGVGCRGGRDEAPEHHHVRTFPPVGPAVTVGFEGKDVDVPVASVPGGADKGPIPLLAIWRAAFPSEDPAPLHFDLVGSDGFRPGSRSKCTRLLTGGEASKARLDPASHDVSFDADLELPGCYRVKAVVRVEAVR